MNGLFDRFLKSLEGLSCWARSLGVFCSLCFFTTHLSAQLTDIHFEKLSVLDGLSSNHVVSIIQDKYGFMWFGTKNGLSRYDGHRFTNFRHHPEDSTTISGDWVEKVFEDYEGNLWVGTYCCGLNLFNRETETFTRYQHIPGDSTSLSHNIVTTIFEDSGNNLWIGTTQGGLNLLDREAGTFKHFRYSAEESNSLSNDNVRAIYEDKQGTLWIGTGGPARTSMGGLNRFDRKTGTFRRYLHDPNDPNTLIDNRVWGLYEDKEETFWVGTWGDGLHIMDREKENFTRLQYNPDDPGQLSCPRLTSENPDQTIYASMGQGITFIYQDRSEIIWLGAFLGGLDRFDPRTGAIEHLEAKSSNPYGFDSNWFWSICEDAQNTLWMSALDGVFKILPGNFNHFQLPHEDLTVQFLFEDSQQVLWAGTNKGLFQADKSGKLLVPIPYDDPYGNDLKRESVFTITEDLTGKIWVGTANGLYQINPAIGQVKLFTHRPGQSNTLSNDHILELYASPLDSSALWIATRDDVLHHYESSSGNFTRFPLGIDSMQIARTNQQADNIITALFQDSKKNLWIGTELGGIFKLDRENRKAEQYIPEILTISCFYEDDKGQFWIGSGNNGLILFDPVNKVLLKQYTEKDGLGSSTVNGIMKDQSGFLWLSTTDGYVSRFDPEKEVFKNYSVKDGLSGKRFFSGSFYKGQNGDFFMGGFSDLISFDPNAFVNNPYPPEVVISKLQVNGIPMVVEGRSAVELSHREKDLVFEFAALHYIRPEDNEVLIMLEGYDQTWQKMGQQREAKYTNLNPGNYTFKMKAASSDEVWSEEVALSILIRSPWWSRWWAYAGYLGLAFGLIYTVYQFQLSRQLEKAEANRLKELDTVKTRLYTNITHEFRTPLTIILGMARKVKEDPGQWFSEGIRMINRNGENLLRLVNQMLDLRKLESGDLPVHLVQGDILLYLKYLLDSFQSYAEAKDIKLHFLTDDQAVLMDYDPGKLQHIVSNLLSNAIKFTPAGGDVYLTVSAARQTGNGHFLNMQVKDNGIGIPAEKLPYVFDRFYQADDRAREGSGIGLALTRELVQLLGGEISVSSQLNQGTTFTIVLPVTNDASIADPLEHTGPAITGAGEDLLPAVDLQAASNTSGELPLALIIEDNIDVRRYLQVCLQNGYRLEMAENGRAGIDKALELIPDVIISDVMMPEKDGYEVCRTLKQDMRTSHIPIILLTAKIDTDSRLTGLETGADAYLAKPFQPEELEVRLKKMIELRRKLQVKYGGTTALSPKDEPYLSPDERFMQKLNGIIKANLSDEAFGIEELCREMAVSRTQLHRKLKALTDTSASHYIRNIRLTKALELLRTTDLSVSQVAYEVGFRHPSYFTESFTARFGMAPSQAR